MATFNIGGACKTGDSATYPYQNEGQDLKIFGHGIYLFQYNIATTQEVAVNWRKRRILTTE